MLKFITKLTKTIKQRKARKGPIIPNFDIPMLPDRCEDYLKLKKQSAGLKNMERSQ